jgi:hypothetical protein
MTASPAHWPVSSICASDGDDLRQHGRGVDRAGGKPAAPIGEVQREARAEREQPQQPAAHDLHRPRRVEERRLLAAPALHDVLPHADVGQHHQDQLHHGGDCHHPEHLGHQQARHDQVAAEPGRLGERVAGDAPPAGAQHPAPERRYRSSSQ